jgi:hypothetical protein
VRVRAVKARPAGRCRCGSTLQRHGAQARGQEEKPPRTRDMHRASNAALDAVLRRGNRP